MRIAEGEDIRYRFTNGGSLHNNLEEIEASDIHNRLGLEKGKYILLSAHREENIDSERTSLHCSGQVNAMAEEVRYARCFIVATQEAANALPQTDSN